MPHDHICPIIFGRTLLNHVNAKIVCKEETTSLKFGEEKVKFHFLKFRERPYYSDLKDQEGITIADLDAILYGTPIDGTEKYL
jgi:hypothetical protein